MINKHEQSYSYAYINTIKESTISKQQFNEPRFVQFFIYL